MESAYTLIMLIRVTPLSFLFIPLVVIEGIGYGTQCYVGLICVFVPNEKLEMTSSRKYGVCLVRVM
jgi:hypothetical protein